MNAGSGVGALWPADVIHVNEDGWVLINRGAAQGVLVGLRLLVVGPGIRTMRDLFVATDTDAGAQAGRPPEAPAVLRLRRTYELLEVVHVEDQCAVAIAARAPAERRPQFYLGTEGELLVWVPLPADYTWPQPGSDTPDDGSADDNNVADDASTAYDDTADGAAEDVDNTDGADDAGSDADTEATDADATPDEPPERITQEDERWEEALPLNGISVGDRVVPAISATSHPSQISGATTPSADPGSSPTDPNIPDWMRPS